jgi:hypothetical protein
MTSDAARRVALQLSRRGLSTPARLLADAHRPLAPLLSDVAAALGPLIRVAGGPGTTALTRLAEDVDALDRVMEEIDAVNGRHAEPG